MMRPYRGHPGGAEGIFYDEKKQRWIIRNGIARSIFWSSQMLSDLKRFYSTTENDELASIFRVSKRTINRKAKELGLEKNPEWLLAHKRRNQVLACSVGKELGYPGVKAMLSKRNK